MIALEYIFNVQYGSNLALNAQKICGSNDNESVAFVSRTSQNNGISARIKPVFGNEPLPAGTLSVAVSGSVLETFLQPAPYYSGYHVYCLMPKLNLNQNEKLYYCMCIRANAFRYNYGRQANKTLKNILLPDPKDIPNWVKAFDAPDFERIKCPVNSNTEVALPPSDDWNLFYLGDLFNITGSKTTPLKLLRRLGSGDYPYVTTQAENNGVEGHYDCSTESGGVITVDSAVAGFASWQPNDFSASDHVEKLTPLFPINVYIALFLVTLLNADQFRYNYGRKASQTRLNKQKIWLPVTKKGEPHFSLMEKYIKSLPFSSTIDH